MTSFPDSHSDLLDAQVASLTTVGQDGVPQATLVWFLHDEGELKLSLNNARLKTRNLTSRPQASLLLLDFSNPYRYLEVHGNVHIEPDPDYAFADKLGAKYGADVRQMDKPGESRVAVTIEPTKVRAVAIG